MAGPRFYILVVMPGIDKVGGREAREGPRAALSDFVVGNVYHVPQANLWRPLLFVEIVQPENIQMLPRNHARLVLLAITKTVTLVNHRANRGTLVKPANT